MNSSSGGTEWLSALGAAFEDNEVTVTVSQLAGILSRLHESGWHIARIPTPAVEPLAPLVQPAPPESPSPAPWWKIADGRYLYVVNNEGVASTPWLDIDPLLLVDRGNLLVAGLSKDDAESTARQIGQEGTVARRELRWLGQRVPYYLVDDIPF